MRVGLRGAHDHPSITQVVDGSSAKGRERVIHKDGQEEHLAMSTKVFFSLTNFHIRTALTLSPCRIYILRFHNGYMLVQGLGFSVLQDYKEQAVASADTNQHGSSNCSHLADLDKT